MKCLRNSYKHGRKVDVRKSTNNFSVKLITFVGSNVFYNI